MKNLPQVNLRNIKKSAFGLIFLFIATHAFGAADSLVVTPGSKNIPAEINKFVQQEGNKIVLFKAGTYHLSNTIKLTNNSTLKGEGEVQLVFDLGGAKNCIEAIGSREKAQRSVSMAYGQEVGETALYKVFNPAPNVKGLSKWGKESLGKLVEAELAEGVLRMNGTLNPVEKEILGDSVLCYKILPVENVSISNLSIKRVDATDARVSNIFLKYSKDCLITDVESENCNYSHITLESTYGVLVVHCKLRKGFDNGNGGKSYGVTLQYGATSNEVSGCVFDSLRHGIVLQLGANRNYIGENYFQNGFWTGVFLPKRSSGDIVLHGDYPYLNFIEGNICNNIVVDDSHGFNGPCNIIEHNKTLLYGIYLNRKAVDGEVYIFDNLIVKKGCFKGRLKLNGNDAESCGNLVNWKLKKQRGECDHASTKENLARKIAESTNDAIEYFGITLQVD
jgi:hypothetical protein